MNEFDSLRWACNGYGRFIITDQRAEAFAEDNLSHRNTEANGAQTGKQRF
jgi:hypothetical protein